MNYIKNIIMIVLGNIILAFGVSTFMIPHNIIIGGSTGIASCMYHYFDIPLSYTILFINVVMFIAGFLFLGKKICFINYYFNFCISNCFRSISITRIITIFL